MAKRMNAGFDEVMLVSTENLRRHGSNKGGTTQGQLCFGRVSLALPCGELMLVFGVTVVVVTRRRSRPSQQHPTSSTTSQQKAEMVGER